MSHARRCEQRPRVAEDSIRSRRLSTASAKTVLPGQRRAPLRIIRSDHWITVRQIPFLPVLPRRHSVHLPKMPRQRPEGLASPPDKPDDPRKPTSGYRRLAALSAEVRALPAAREGATGLIWNCWTCARGGPHGRPPAMTSSGPRRPAPTASTMACTRRGPNRSSNGPKGNWAAVAAALFMGAPPMVYPDSETIRPMPLYESLRL
jgi:hypothetical protein